MKKLFLLNAAFLCILSMRAQSFWQEKIDHEVWQQAPVQGAIEYFVIMKEQANTKTAKLLRTKDQKATHVYQKLKDVATQTQASALHLIKQQANAYRCYSIVNGIWVQSNYNLMEILAKRTDVRYIAPNPVIKNDFPVKSSSLANTKNQNSGAEWGITMIKADQLWDKNISGQGVVVGGQDTGYEWYHPAIKNQYSGDSSNHNYYWHDAIHGQLGTDSFNACGYDVLYPCDDGSHGTHTMGTIVGDDGFGNQIGVAPASNWIGCRNMDNGYGTPTTYIECFEWFLAPTDTNNQNPNPVMAPHVIANSWGCPPSEGCNPSNFYMMQLAIENLKNAGTFVAVSAGNDGWSGCHSIRNPASIFEASFSVGASDIQDTLANFSSRGSVMVDSSFRLKPNVTAPGVNVRSCVPGNGYASYSGTSMAGPHVAGAVALLISAQPGLAGQVDSLENILEQTADTIYTYRNDTCGGTPQHVFPNNMVGFGRINLWKALQVVRPDLTNLTESIHLAEELMVYPNPFSDFIHIQTNQPLTNCNILVRDALGRVLKQLQIDYLQHLQISLADLPKAIYYIQVQNEEKRLMGKVLKN